MTIWQNILNEGLMFVQDNWSEIILKVIGTFAVFVAMQIVDKWIVNKIKNKIRENSFEIKNDKYTERTANLIGSIAHVVIIVVTVFVIFAFLGLEVSLILGGFSIAIGFAMETTIKNMISGIFILSNKKMKIGDFVEILGPFNLRGTIEEVTLRHTIIRLIDKTRVIIPNGRLADAATKTLKSETMIRAEIDVHVPRHTNLEQVKNLLITTINENEYVLNKDYTSSIITGFDKNGFSIKSFFYYNPQMGKSSYVLNSDFRIALTKIFKKYGIKAPYEEEVYNMEYNI